MSGVPSLFNQPIHLGLGATAVTQPDMTGGMDWYDAYSARVAGDGADGRLVSLHTFSESWTSWEMHPRGEEVVVCTAGSITLHQEMPDGSRVTMTLRSGDYAINPRGAWHTADVSGDATALFITAGEGTETRPR